MIFQDYLLVVESYFDVLYRIYSIHDQPGRKSKNHYIHHIEDDFQSIQAKIDNEFKDSDYYQKFVLAIHQIDNKKVHGKALLQIPKKHHG